MNVEAVEHELELAQKMIENYNRGYVELNDNEVQRIKFEISDLRAKLDWLLK